MNSQTGDIFRYFDEKTLEANFGKPITLQESMELSRLNDTQERLRRYKQDHAVRQVRSDPFGITR